MTGERDHWKLDIADVVRASVSVPAMVRPNNRRRVGEAGDRVVLDVLANDTVDENYTAENFYFVGEADQRFGS